ncbi:MAG: GGDEF domain-containing protein [Treponema sp.]|nr:GGDEF domain-containing protein [Treponema sp.]
MDEKLDRALEHIKQLLKENTIPPLTGDLAEIPELIEIHDEIKSAREILASFSTRHEEVLSALTESLCREIEKWSEAMDALHESETRFKYLANHDPLTGAMNRRSFMERAAQELNDAFRHHYPCGVIMIDIDHFKLFNDTYGHQAGDEALRHAVKIISSCSRSHDFLGRYGGEEFVFFFCHADNYTSLKIAERIRTTLEENPVILQTGDVPVTASLGVVIAKQSDDIKFEKLGNYLETLISYADRAMYTAKKNGRNKVVLYDYDNPQTFTEKYES